MKSVPEKTKRKSERNADVARLAKYVVLCGLVREEHVNISVGAPVVTALVQLRPSTSVIGVHLECGSYGVVLRTVVMPLSMTQYPAAQTFVQELEKFVDNVLIRTNENGYVIVSAAKTMTLKSVHAALDLVTRIASDVDEFLDYLKRSPALQADHELTLKSFCVFAADPCHGVEAAVDRAAMDNAKPEGF